MKSLQDKPRCNGQWTEARYRSFIISALRGASRRWGPRAEAKRRARVSRGVYRCAECNGEHPLTSFDVYKSGKKKGLPKKVKNDQMDHVIPVVDPRVGPTTWGDYIERLFVEVDGWRCICYKCHEKVTAEERAVRTARGKSNGQIEI